MRTGTFFSSVIKATALALVFSLIGILIFAVAVKFAAPSETVIKTVNQFIKVVAVFLGCFFSVQGKAGIVKGGASGALCTFLLYAVFSLISGSQLFGLQMFADLMFTAVIGGIAGIVAVNVRGKD